MFRRLISILSIFVICLGGVGCEPNTEPDLPAKLNVTPDDQLWSAINQGDLEAATQAIQSGADPNFVRKLSDAANDEFSPLQRAATRGDLEIAKTLIAHGADVNQVTSGTTALHVAITMLKAPSESLDRTEQIGLIRFLLENGADVNALNRLDRTPLDTAVDDPEVAELLKSRGGLSTAEIQDRELEKIENQGGGLIGEIPDSVEDLKQREKDLAGENGVEREDIDGADPLVDEDKNGPLRN